MRRAIGLAGFGSFVAALWAIAVPGAQAQVTIYESLTGAEIAAILKDEGLPARVDQDASGDPIVYSETRGARFGVLTYDCDEAERRSCRSIQFKAIWALGRDPKRDDIDRLNRFNHQFLYGSASFDEDGDVHLAYAHDVEGGVTHQNLRSSVRIWRAIVPRFLETFTGALPQVSVDRPGHYGEVTNPSPEKIAHGESALTNPLSRAFFVKDTGILEANR